TLRRLGEWKRRSRKQPQNRVRRQAIRDDEGNRVGVEVVGPWPEPALCPVFCKRGKVTRRGGGPAGDGVVGQVLRVDSPDAGRAAGGPASPAVHPGRDPGAARGSGGVVWRGGNDRAGGPVNGGRARRRTGRHVSAPATLR